MTLKEIAAMAGVSASTVSRVVNGKNTKAASSEVRDRIWKIVSETGYTPNQNAQSLQHGFSGAPQIQRSKIYVIFARKIDSYIDPFFTELMHAIEKEAFSRKYPIQTIMTDVEFQNINTGSPKKHSAAIILGHISSTNLSFLKTRFKHLVYIGLNALPESAQIDQVLCSGYKAARLAVAYLAGLGHKKIFYIGETRKEERYEGYMDEMRSLGIPPQLGYVHQSPLSPQGGYQCMGNILSQQMSCTAIFCANDDTSIGVVRALLEHGINIPRDISVIGMDDIEMSRYLSPMLTTVHIPIEEMGKQAAKVLIDRIEGGHKTPMKINFPSMLSPRESCSAPKNK